MSYVLPPHESPSRKTLSQPVLKHTSVWKEAKLLLDLAIPTIVVHLGFTVPPCLTASYVGRVFGYVYLDGYTLATLTGNLTTLALLQGLYSASDTLQPQAFGVGNFREVGILAIRGFIGSMMILAPITLILIIFLEKILIAAGQDPEAAMYAWHFYMIYGLSLPFYALYVILWKFISAQNVMRPIVVTVLISSAIVLPVSLELFTHSFGFLGAPSAILFYQVVEACSLLGYLAWRRPFLAETWPGLSAWKEALDKEKFSAYMLLGVGGMLASLEWIYWEALSLIIGTLGVIPLSVHTIPTQVILVTFMAPLGLGVALSIRLGATLPNNVLRAKELVAGCYLVGTVLFGAMAILMYVWRHAVFRFFTTQAQVLEGCEMIWTKVCFYFFNLSIFGITMGTATGLGMQWTLGIATLVALWCLGLPASYYFAVVQGQGINAAWEWIWPPYMAINVFMIFAFMLKDWDEVAKQIRIREGLESQKGELETLVLEPYVDERYGSTGGKI